MIARDLGRFVSGLFFLYTDKDVFFTLWFPVMFSLTMTIVLALTLVLVPSVTRAQSCPEPCLSPSTHRALVATFAQRLVSLRHHQDFEYLLTQLQQRLVEHQTRLAALPSGLSPSLINLFAALYTTIAFEQGRLSVQPHMTRGPLAPYQAGYQSGTGSSYSGQMTLSSQGYAHGMVSASSGAQVFSSLYGLSLSHSARDVLLGLRSATGIDVSFRVMADATVIASGTVSGSGSLVLPLGDLPGGLFVVQATHPLRLDPETTIAQSLPQNFLIK
ncbi:MAG: hypothetical protein NZL83_03500 [Candidatus Absconditabacterales bacterium]|nr:hypothetical protein [Candidatus Absconditabacterales bacterium]